MDFYDVTVIIFLILVIILMLIFISLPLFLTARWLGEEEGFLRALGVTILLIASFLLCLIFIPNYYFIDLIVAILINLVIIKYAYDTEWGKAFAMWIITIVIAIIILIIIGIVTPLVLLSFT
jgi:hypothetical protein